MKSRYLLVLAALMLALSALATWTIADEADTEAASEPAASSDGPIRHVVLLKFKPEASGEDIAEVEAAFAGLKDKIDAIADLEWGTNNSPETHDKGFTHCFLLTFDSDEDRATYLPHPAHKEFGHVLRPHMADVLVVDYTPE